MVTIRDVAKHAGVSPATVSRVINGPVGYSDETRERVEDAVRSLSYETDFLVRGLKTRQASVIGLHVFRETWAALGRFTGAFLNRSFARRRRNIPGPATKTARNSLLRVARNTSV